MNRPALLLLTLLVAGVFAGCAYRPYATDLEPVAQERQAEGMTVADDGTVTFSQGRLEVGLRPMTDEELNRQFGAYSEAGAHSTNPYTYGDSRHFMTGETPRRFTVFHLTVKNYEFPKVRLAGELVASTANGRRYYGLGLDQLDVYYRAYAVGFRGTDHKEYKDRRDMLRRTMFPTAEDIFSGQEVEGYVMLKPLADDVTELTINIADIVTRFDYKGDPVEMIDASFKFRRDVGRIYPDGRMELTSR